MAKILVVDDEASLRMVMARILKSDHHEVLEAENGAAALALAGSAHPDVVLLDYRLPGENGEEILMKLKAAHPRLPVIMVTGYGRVDSAVDLVKAGAFDYVAKPFENRKLLETVRRAVTQHELAEDGSPMARELLGQAFPRETSAPEPPASRASVGKADRRRWLGWVLGGAVAIAGAGGWWWSHRGGMPAGALVGPGTHTAALAWSEKKLWLSDWYLQKVYVGATVHGLEISKTYLNSRHVTGIAVLPQEVIMCDPLEKKLFRFRREMRWEQVAEILSPGPSPSGLCWDGREALWSVDRQTVKLYRHQLNGALSVVGEWPAIAAAPVGVAAEDDHVWVADAQTETLVEMTVESETGPAVTGRYQLPARPGRLSGFTMGDGMVWLAYEGDREILRVSKESLRRLP